MYTVGSLIPWGFVVHCTVFRLSFLPWGREATNSHILIAVVGVVSAKIYNVLMLGCFYGYDKKFKHFLSLSVNEFYCLFRETEDMNPNLTVLSWNVDGLDGRNILERTRKVCHTINSRKPDIVFLQEVIKDTLSIYQSKCPG